MPTYEAICLDCDLQYSYHSSIAACQVVQPCPVCHGEGRKVILSAPLGFVKGKFEQFRSQVDGTLIRTEQDLREHNKRNGVVLLGEGYSEEELKNLKPSKPQEVSKEEVIKDIMESMKEVESGYKPERVETNMAPTEGWSNAEVPNE